MNSDDSMAVARQTSSNVSNNEELATLDRVGTNGALSRLVTGIVQLWDNGGTLGAIAYDPSDQYYTSWSNSNLGAGPDAKAWLTVDMQGFGINQIVQTWDNSGALGMTVYSPQPDGGYKISWSSSNVGAGSGAEKWLVVDMAGNGINQIVQLWNNGGQLAMIVYAPQADGSYKLSWSSPDMGQGSGAIEWLAMDTNGDGKAEIVQLWDNGGQLGMIIYAPQVDGSYKSTWSSSNMGQGSGAIRYLAVDMNGDGKTEIAQLWDNDGQLGMIIYAPQANGSYKSTWSTPNIGQGSGAMKWLAVDMSGEGKTEIVQLWDNDGQLGMIVYAPQADGSYKSTWSSSDMGQGSGAVAWLGMKSATYRATDVVQLWNNDGQLGMIVYAPQSDGSYKLSWSSPNMGQGSGAIDWLVVDTSGDGLHELVQLWNNGGKLGMILYANHLAYGLKWGSDNLGEGSGAESWLTVDTAGDGVSRIAQMWDNSGQLGMILYSPQTDGSYKVTWSSSDMGQGSGAFKWLAVDMNGDGKTEIVQLWDNGGQLGMIVYAPQANGGYKSNWSSPDMDQGSSAIGWVVVDPLGDGRDSIMQLWNNNGKLGMILYSPQSNGSYAVSWSSPNVGSGPGALEWLAVDVNGDGKTEVVQLWVNNGTLAMIVYAPQANGSYAISSSSGNLGSAPNAIQWLVADMNGDGKSEIVQLRDNSGTLGMTVYKPQSDGSYKVSWSTSNVGSGSGAVAWLVVDMLGYGVDQIVQLWNNGGQLGIIVYAPQSDGSYAISWSTDDVGSGASAVAFLPCTNIRTNVDMTMTDMRSSLLTYYPLMGDADDYSGKGHNATATSQVTYVPGIVGWAAKFAQIGAAVGFTPIFQPRGIRTFSISAWVILTALGPVSGDNAPISTITGGLGVRAADGTVLYTFSYLISPGGTPQSITIQGTRPLMPQVWAHLAVAIDTYAGVATLHINGRLDATVTLPKPIIALEPSGGVIGAANATGSSGVFNGTIGNVFYFNAPLSPTAVTALANYMTYAVEIPPRPNEEEAIDPLTFVVVVVTVALTKLFAEQRLLDKIKIQPSASPQLSLPTIAARIAAQAGSPVNPSIKLTRADLGIPDSFVVKLDVGGLGVYHHDVGGTLAGFPDTLNLNDVTLNPNSVPKNQPVQNLVLMPNWNTNPMYPFVDGFADVIYMQNAPLYDIYVPEIARVLRSGGTVGLWIDEKEFGRQIAKLAALLKCKPLPCNAANGNLDMDEMNGRLPHVSKLLLRKNT